MKAAEMLARDLVLRVCASDGEFRRDWLARGAGPKRVVPFAVTPGVDPELAAAIAGAAAEMGATRLLACRTRAAFMYDPVSVLPVSSQALLELADRWGQPDDFLVCLPDGSAALVASVAGYALAAGPPLFVAALAGPDVATTRQRFAAWARESGDQRLRLVAGRYGSGPSSRHGPRRMLRADFAERLSVLAASVRRWRAVTAVLRALRAAAGWAAITVIVITLLSAPRSSHVLPALGGAVWLLLQVFALARTHTLSWAACLRMMAAGAAAAVVFATTAWLTLSHELLHTWRALLGPAEELVKLVPVAVFWLAARNRFTRMAAVDYVLAGVASGAGFALAENTAAALSAPGTGWHLAALLPGWSDAGSVRFPGQAVTTGLAAAGFGLAVAAWSAGADGPVARRRWWRWLAWVLPPALVGMALLDHYHYDAVAGGVAVPGWVPRLHAALGDGHASRFVLLALIVAAVVLDFGAQRRVADLVPPLPGVPVWAGAARAARAGQIRARLRSPAQTMRGKLARHVAGIRVALAEDGVRACHEVAFALVALRRRRPPRGVLAASLAFLRQRREGAMREARANGGVTRDVPRREGLWAAWQRLVTVLALAGPAAFAAIVSRRPAPLPSGHARPADLVATIPALHAWFSQFIPAGQVLIIAAAFGVLVILVSGWAFSVPLARRRGTGGPGRFTRSLASIPAPGQLVFGMLGLTGELLPPATAALLRGESVAHPYRRLPLPQRAIAPPGLLSASPQPAAPPREADERVRPTPPRAADSELGRSGWLFPPQRVRRWLSHAPEFGVEPAPGDEQPDAADLTARLIDVLREISEAAGSLRLDAVTFRNHPARAVIDRATGAAVFFTPAGEFTGCAMLTEEQLYRLVGELKL